MSAYLSKEKIIEWKNLSTWNRIIKNFLEPYLDRSAFVEIVKSGPLEICSDDTEWLAVLSAASSLPAEDLANGYLSDELKSYILRTYHGCRAVDVGEFYQNGVRINDSADLSRRARQLVMEDDRLASMRATIDQRIATFECKDRDVGNVYLVLDDREQLDDSGAGHYCLYGSEWIQILLGWEAHETLRSTGVPTILHIDMPLIVASASDRRELANALLLSWTHSVVNKARIIRQIDFTFSLKRDVPPEWIVGHDHPERLFDPFYRCWRYSDVVTCPHCT